MVARGSYSLTFIGRGEPKNSLWLSLRAADEWFHRLRDALDEAALTTTMQARADGPVITR